MAKSIVEDCKKVQMWWLKRHGYLNGFASGSIIWTSGYDDSKSSIGITVNTRDLFVYFQYTQTDYYTDEKSVMDYKFDLTSTPCNYGGLRYWFICGLYKNGRYCGRMVAKLYKPPGGKWFGCRHCWDLSYYDRQQNRGGKYGFLFQAVELEDKVVKLEEKMKRWYWQRRPTKKHRQLLNLANKLKAYSPLIDSLKTRFY